MLSSKVSCKMFSSLNSSLVDFITSLSRSRYVFFRFSISRFSQEQLLETGKFTSLSSSQSSVFALSQRNWDELTVSPFSPAGPSGPGVPCKQIISNIMYADKCHVCSR